MAANNSSDIGSIGPSGQDLLRKRTKDFALRVVALCGVLQRTPLGRTIAAQLRRAGTSVAANYRAACRGRSRKEFIAKIGIVIEEGDECLFWLELTAETGLVPKHRLTPLITEANELVAIFVATRCTARRRTA